MLFYYIEIQPSRHYDSPSKHLVMSKLMPSGQSLANYSAPIGHFKQDNLVKTCYFKDSRSKLACIFFINLFCYFIV